MAAPSRQSLESESETIGRLYQSAQVYPAARKGGESEHVNRLDDNAPPVVTAPNTPCRSGSDSSVTGSVSAGSRIPLRRAADPAESAPRGRSPTSSGVALPVWRTSPSASGRRPASPRHAAAPTRSVPTAMRSVGHRANTVVLGWRPSATYRLAEASAVAPRLWSARRATRCSVRCLHRRVCAYVCRRVE